MHIAQSSAGETGQPGIVARNLAAERAQSQHLVVMVAHEMRNMISSIAYSERLLAHDDAAAAHARKVISRQVSQLRRLVDDLVDVACSKDGRISLRRQAIDMRDVAAAAVEVARPCFDARQQQVIVELASAPALIEADDCRLTQALGNLLINASKFSPRGGRIWLTIEREGTDVVARVRDCGEGISAEALPHIFDIYVRAGSPREEAVGGLGLGLTISRQLVQLHGGSLVARSAGLGKGSEFVMSLPGLRSG